MPIPCSRGVHTSFYSLFKMFSTNQGTPQYYSPSGHSYNQGGWVAYSVAIFTSTCCFWLYPHVVWTSAGDLISNPLSIEICRACYPGNSIGSLRKKVLLLSSSPRHHHCFFPGHGWFMALFYPHYPINRDYLKPWLSHDYAHYQPSLTFIMVFIASTSSKTICKHGIYGRLSIINPHYV